ncbi:MAG: hypothetical protein HY934_00515, partial [Candidatus Firestonebacteria bacterium]|nr:hypothetical protein [Candidatus Firestonebacteria bacterium]
MKKICLIAFSCCFFIMLFSPVFIHSAEEKSFTIPHLVYTIPSEKFIVDKGVRRPTGVTSYKGDIYVSDSFNHRIIAFNELGEVLYTFGSEGSEPGKFSGQGTI